MEKKILLLGAPRLYDKSAEVTREELPDGAFEEGFGGYSAGFQETIWSGTGH